MTDRRFNITTRRPDITLVVECVDVEELERLRDYVRKFHDQTPGAPAGAAVSHPRKGVARSLLRSGAAVTAATARARLSSVLERHAEAHKTASRLPLFGFSLDGAQVVGAYLAGHDTALTWAELDLALALGEERP